MVLLDDKEKHLFAYISSRTLHFSQKDESQENEEYLKLFIAFYKNILFLLADLLPIVSQ